MGYTPRDVDALTPWELQAALDGWIAANSSDSTPPPMSDERAAELGIEGF